MKREAYQKLLHWKNQSDRKPLIIQGARQVGKTWLMKEFGQNEFENVAYINFESNQSIHSLFKEGYNTNRILEALNIFVGFHINPKSTLIIFDEIQACPQALNSLKYFQEEKPNYAIFAAGSLLGVSMHQGTSFPVGKVSFLNLYPLSFSEFLLALNQVALLKPLEESDEELVSIFNQKYTDLLRQYYFVGGMPEAVAHFIKNKDYSHVREIQQRILSSYENDFSKHAPINQVLRIRLVWQSIISQLSKENSKFIYNLLRTGARAKEFELAIEWLHDAGLIHKVNRISKPAIPINSYADWSDFKIFLSDVGLMSAMGGLSPQILLEGNELFQEFKGTLTEQFILQQIICNAYQPYYWTTENSKAEIDFVIQKNNQVIPIEVKAAENLRSRSLRLYYDKYKPKQCIRTSLSNFKKQDWMKNIPLYAFNTWLQSMNEDEL
jgi:predicted AAA+ superfamily ATPase